MITIRFWVAFIALPIIMGLSVAVCVASVTMIVAWLTGGSAYVLGLWTGTQPFEKGIVFFSVFPSVGLGVALGAEVWRKIFLNSRFVDEHAFGHYFSPTGSPPWLNAIMHCITFGIFPAFSILAYWEDRYDLTILFGLLGVALLYVLVRDWTHNSSKRH